MDTPINRASLRWLLAAQLLVILPLLPWLPGWMAGLGLICMVWRWRIFRQQAHYPGTPARLLLIAGCAAAVYLSRGQLAGLEAGAALLVAAFLLKTLEMRSQRDALVVILLGFFTLTLGYLFDDHLLAALYSLIPVSVLLAALAGLQHDAPPLVLLRLAGRLLLQALPLMLLLFIGFPRLAPLWHLPQPGHQGISGLADSLSPGEFAELGLSSELAFRARFSGPLPAPEQRYWRAITFDQFDGQRWSRGPASHDPGPPDWQPRGTVFDYSILLQPGPQPWLVALDISRPAGPAGRMMADFHLEQPQPPDQPLLYRLQAWPEARREPEHPRHLASLLQLPARGNPRSRALGEQLRQQEPDLQRRVGQLLARFRQQPYRYSLKPAATGPDSVDDFLFDTREGFCIHYASAMTFVLRAAGIPARIVAGYQGGELNPDGAFLTIRQFDAHAWLEYWLPGTGWQSADPTRQVAPERIRLGMAQAMSHEPDFLREARPALRHYPEWLNGLRHGWERLNYGWQRWVLNYQGEQQQALLHGLQDGLEHYGTALLASLATLLAGSLLIDRLRHRPAGADPLERLRLDYEQQLARRSLNRQPGEGLQDFATRAAAAWPEQAPAIRAFARAYQQARYAGQPPCWPVLRQSLRQLHRKS